MKVYEVPAAEYNKLLAEQLKKLEEFEMPEWALFIKTGVSKKRPPTEKDFWYKRAASILRQIYIHGIVGVGRLKTRYGSRKNRGVKPERFKKGSGKLIRTILQQGEKAGFLEKVKDKRSGRRLTQKGKDFLDSIKYERKKEVKEPVEKEIGIKEGKKEKVERAGKKGIKEGKKIIKEKIEAVKKKQVEEKQAEKKPELKVKEEKSTEKKENE